MPDSPKPSCFGTASMLDPLKAPKLIRSIISGILDLPDLHIIFIRITDLNMNPVADLMPQDCPSNGGLRADIVIQGIAPHGGHQLVNFLLVIILAVQRHRIVEADLICPGGI